MYVPGIRRFFCADEIAAGGAGSKADPRDILQELETLAMKFEGLDDALDAMKSGVTIVPNTQRTTQQAAAPEAAPAPKAAAAAAPAAPPAPPPGPTGPPPESSMERWAGGRDAQPALIGHDKG